MFLYRSLPGRSSPGGGSHSFILCARHCEHHRQHAYGTRDDYEEGRAAAAKAFETEASVIDFIYEMATDEALKFMGNEKKRRKVVDKWKTIRKLISE